MPLHPIFRITIKNGQVKVQNQEKRMHFIRSLADGEYEEIIRKPRKPRSNEQNAYYWAVIVKIISEEIGYTPDETHEALKWMFLKKEVNREPLSVKVQKILDRLSEKIGISISWHRKGEPPNTIRSTTSLSTKEMEDYNESCRRWAASELNIMIPAPNEVDYSLYEQSM